MSVTKDVSSLTNSIMMDMDKTFRKNGLGPHGHRHYEGNRKLIEAMVAMMLLDKEKDLDDVKGS